jgi:hypothetical protein
MAIEHSDTKLLAIFLGASQCLFSLKDGANNKWIINSGASFEYETCMFGTVYGVQIGVLRLSSRSHMLLRAGWPHRKRNLSIGAFATCFISKHELRLSFVQPSPKRVEFK